MLKLIENIIITNLLKSFEDFEIDSFPVDFEAYSFTNSTGCILLRYENSDMSAQNAIYSVMSDETYNFTVFTGIRYAQKHSDCYDYLNKLKTVLNGMAILNKRMVLKKIDFQAEINGDLWYTYDIQIKQPLTDIYKDQSVANKVVYIEERI